MCFRPLLFLVFFFETFECFPRLLRCSWDSFYLVVTAAAFVCVCLRFSVNAVKSFGRVGHIRSRLFFFLSVDRHGRETFPIFIVTSLSILLKKN